MEIAKQTLYFFESFLVGGYGKTLIMTIKDVFFFEDVRSFFFVVNDDERVVGRVWAAGLLVERVLGRRPF